MKRAKVVCTIGPASREPAVLRQLADAGMDVARLNMSHGIHEEHAEAVRELRAIASAVGRPIGILQDLAGPKIRLGRLEAPVLLHAGDRITLTAEGGSEPGQTDGAGRSPAEEGLVLPVAYPRLAEELVPGDRLSLADGLIELEITEKGGSRLSARVVSGGQVSSRKGVNLPGKGEHLPALTPKDAEDLRFGLSLGVDWVALSFVRSARDADAARAVMDSVGRRVPLLAKIEKRQALADIDAILDTFDGIMVARGDLGVEVPLEDVPGIQKDLIRRANRLAKPVITATQMLLSMVTSPRPTRAEVTDVTNAILDGTDAVMLSEETAQGMNPVAAAATMALLADRAEGLRERVLGEGAGPSPVPEAIARATGQVARAVGASLIATPTASGSTARLVASLRPAVPILALSSVRETVQALTLTWGVTPRFLRPVPTTDALFDACRAEAAALGLARPGDRIVVTAGLPIYEPGSTNLLRVLEA